jgi:hypothetical protein
VIAGPGAVNGPVEGEPAVGHVEERAVRTAAHHTLSSTNRFATRGAQAQYDRRIDHVLYAPADHYPVVVDLAF